MKLGAAHGGLRSGKRSAGWPVGSAFNMTLQGNRQSTARGGLMLDDACSRRPASSRGRVLGPPPATQKGAFDSRHSQRTFRLHGIAQHRSINDSQHIARVGKVVHDGGRSLGRAPEYLDRVLASGHLVHKTRSTSSSMQFTTHSWHTTYTGKRWRAKGLNKM